jgi:hypothetical protein
MAAPGLLDSIQGFKKGGLKKTVTVVKGLEVKPEGKGYIPNTTLPHFLLAIYLHFDHFITDTFD